VSDESLSCHAVQVYCNHLIRRKKGPLPPLHLDQTPRHSNIHQTLLFSISVAYHLMRADPQLRTRGVILKPDERDGVIVIGREGVVKLAQVAELELV
jgi:hypothetical protein